MVYVGLAILEMLSEGFLLACLSELSHPMSNTRERRKPFYFQALSACLTLTVLSSEQVTILSLRFLE